MKVDFLELNTTGGKKTVARTSIAMIEQYGTIANVTLNINDVKGMPIKIITIDSYEALISILSKS